MPTAVGPNILGEENLVFGYDLGDVSNSYRGEPTVNKAGGVHLGFNGARWAKRTEYPQKGALPFKLAGDVYQLISGNNYWGSASDFSPAYNKTYTLSYWYYLSTDSNLGVWHNAFFGVPQGGGSQYTTVSTKTNDTFSIVGTNTWRFGSVNITTNTPVDSYTYLRGTYTAGSSDVLPTGQIYIANFQLEENPHVTPFTTGTRSATQGLLDLTGNSTIDLTNVSFDSNAQMVFDGTDDYLNVNTSLNSGNFTYETVMSVNDTTYPIFGAGYGTAGTTIQSYITSSGALINLYAPIGAGGWVYGSYSNLNGYVSVANRLRHIVVTNNNTVWQTYVDGYLVGNVTFYQPTTGTDVGIGRIAMQSPSNLSTVVKMVKLYNRVLTSTEVLNNYNNIKRKYGI
jgi:hypothetical protein